jgi:hypothetical protein
MVTVRKAGGQIFAVAILASCLALGGCGGSGGAGSAALSGTVNSTTGGRASGTAVAGATIKAFAWPDLAAVVATTTTDASGHYDVPLAPALIGKDIFITAEKTSGSPPVTTRWSTLVNDLPAAGTTNANIDPSTTVAAEAVAKKARDSNVTDISGTAFATIASEVKRNLSGVDSLSFAAGGTVVPSSFGAGLVGGSSAANFVANSTTVQSALSSVNDTANSDVKQAKRITQMLRDLSTTVTDAGNAEKDSLNAALEEQKTAINNSTQLASAFGTRAQFVGTMVTTGDPGPFSDEGLLGKPSGIYEQRVVDNGVGGTRNGLVRTGDSSDGKSWTVTSTLAGATQGMALTITPASAVSTFGVTTSSPGMTIHVTKPSDASVVYDGTLALTKDTSSNITQAVVHLTVQDSALTKPITVNGTLTGTPTTGSTPANPDYTQFAFSGNLDSQFGTASVGNLSVTFYGSSAGRDVKQIRLSSFNLSTTNAKPATVAVSSATLDFQPADPANGFNHSKPNHANISASLQASGHTLTVTNADATLVPLKTTSGGNTVAVSGLSGSVSYASPVLTFSGSVNGMWQNAGATGTSVASFPKGSVHLVGSLTPVNGSPATVDMTLTSDNAVSNNTVTANLTVAKLSFDTENLAGTAKEVFSVQNDTVQANPTVTVDITHSPSNETVHLSGPANNLAGTIKTSGGTTVAQIGQATDLQIPDLGSVTIIKYGDNTFETAVSILP